METAPRVCPAIRRDDSTLSAQAKCVSRFTGAAQPGSGHLTAGLSWNERTATSGNR